MIDENEVKKNIAANIAAYRRAENITQSELAEMLNYSDKAVSKWERAESMPDIAVLCRIAEIFHITVNDLIVPPIEKKISGASTKLKRRIIIPLLSVGLVWLVSVVVFVFMGLFSNIADKSFCFIYAIPVSFIVLVVFSILWWPKAAQVLCISGLLWTVSLAIHLTMNAFTNITETYLVYIIAIPLQIMVPLWYIMNLSPKVSGFFKRVFDTKENKNKHKKDQAESHDDEPKTD